MTAPYCAHCHNHVAPDSEHVVIEASIRHYDGRAIEDYMMHTDCYRELSESWMVPA